MRVGSYKPHQRYQVEKHLRAAIRDCIARGGDADVALDYYNSDNPKDWEKLISYWSKDNLKRLGMKPNEKVLLSKMTFEEQQKYIRNLFKIVKIDDDTQEREDPDDWWKS